MFRCFHWCPFLRSEDKGNLKEKYEKTKSAKSPSYFGESSKNSVLWEIVAGTVSAIEESSFPTCSTSENMKMSWESPYWDIPGTRAWQFLAGCRTAWENSRVILETVDLRLFTCVGSGSDLWIFTLDQLEPEKSSRDWPNNARRILLAVHFACCVTRTSSNRRVAPLLRFFNKDAENHDLLGTIRPYLSK